MGFRVLAIAALVCAANAFNASDWVRITLDDVSGGISSIETARKRYSEQNLVRSGRSVGVDSLVCLRHNSE